MKDPHPSAREFVVRVLNRADAGQVARQLRSAGIVEPLTGHADLYVVNLTSEAPDAKEGWTQIKNLVGPSAQVSPVLVDPDGTRRYAVGNVVARFSKTPSKLDMESLSKLGLQVQSQSKFAPEQVKLGQREPSEQFLPDVLRSLHKSMPHVSAWLETLSAFKRS